MVNGAFKLAARTDDFGLERRDARFEFLYGEGIEILAAERADGIVGTFRKDFLVIHAPNVDPNVAAVNKRAAGCGANGGMVWRNCPR
jgi:hypothetical protein